MSTSVPVLGWGVAAMVVVVGGVGVVLGHLGGYSVREWRTDKLI